MFMMLVMSLLLMMKRIRAMVAMILFRRVVRLRG